MRQITIGILCTAAFLAASCNKHPENEASANLNAGSEAVNAVATYYTIAADKVTGKRSTGISGSFKITEASSPPGIDSQRYGGGCIVFPAHELGYAVMASRKCDANDDCSKPDPTIDRTKEESAYYVPDASKPSQREHRFGYCDQVSHKCWSRPVYMNGDFVNPKTFAAQAALCQIKIKSPPFNHSPWPVDKDNPLSVSATNLAGFGLKPGAIHARVVACLQGTTATPATGCASVSGTNRIEVMGPEAVVTP